MRNKTSTLGNTPCLHQVLDYLSLGLERPLSEPIPTPTSSLRLYGVQIRVQHTVTPKDHTSDEWNKGVANLTAMAA
jgi:hypothetical protein